MLWNCKENHRICFQNPKKCYNGGLLEKVCFHPVAPWTGFVIMRQWESSLNFYLMFMIYSTWPSIIII